MQPSRRMAAIRPFLVMEVLEAAQELERAGEDVVHLEVGEPDFDTPSCVVTAAERALREGRTHYTHSLGLLQLREAICAYYAAQHGVAVEPDRVIVTSGTSPAFVLVFGVLCDPGDEVVLSDPGFACYAHTMHFLGLCPRTFALCEAEGYRYRIDRIREQVTPRTKAILVNSPANPTGSVIGEDELAAICELGVPVVSDEIYHGLVYGGAQPQTALRFSDNAIVLNGFSKRYAMTGWRLGWIVAPRDLVPALQRAQQNLFICAADFVQHAGIAALEQAGPDVERMREEYAQRRGVLLEGLRSAGLGVPYEPEGAFYILANASHISADSRALAHEVLNSARVGVTPGVDFGPGGEGYLRFSYTRSVDRIQEGLSRLQRFLASRQTP